MINIKITFTSNIEKHVGELKIRKLTKKKCDEFFKFARKRKNMLKISPDMKLAILLINKR